MTDAVAPSPANLNTHRSSRKRSGQGRGISPGNDVSSCLRAKCHSPRRLAAVMTSLPVQPEMIRAGIAEMVKLASK